MPARCRPTPRMPLAEPFGDSVELADELIALVVDGPKRATAGSYDEYVAQGSPVPEVGGLSIDPAWVDVPGFGGQAIAKDVGRRDSTIVWSRPDRILVEMSNVCAVDPAPIG
jgi:hypothetical protein